MPYPQVGELYRHNDNPSEIILIIGMSESKRLVKTQHLTNPQDSGHRGLDDIKWNWKPLTKESK